MFNLIGYDGTVKFDNILQEDDKASMFKKCTSIEVACATIAITNANYFDVAKGANEFIVPLYAIWHTFVGVQFGDSSIRVITKENVTSPIDFYYLIIHI